MSTIRTRQEAKSLNEKKYFNGAKCPNGHLSDRYTSSARCCECVKVKSISRYNENKDAIKTSMKEYYQLNKEKMDNISNIRRKNNPKDHQRYSKKWSDANRDKVYKMGAKWRKNNPHKNSMYATAWRAALKRSIPNWINLNEVEDMYKDCARKTIDTGILHCVDHIVPLQSNRVCGLHCESNLQVLTKSENSRKSNITWPDMPSKENNNG